ncbi:hypothetical protein TUZN_0857 [Thermoproteus uzoniensis 768-20]|uniref:Uncharacterized protein n=1 Tax=Thermoproteus uzoniensis (strain 768-20) TaxID=999630 RepID=F2L5H2_THEU7|nr:hypothetical protein [Thermoproteus uzoniensis]AEA12343.1 hypothetical protein TUZN_0857 [Thermoproteus uzoniensis 768-20]
MVNDKIKAAIGMLILIAYVGSVPQVLAWCVIPNGSAAGGAATGAGAAGATTRAQMASDLTAAALILFGLGWAGLVAGVAKMAQEKGSLLKVFDFYTYLSLLSNPPLLSVAAVMYLVVVPIREYLIRGGPTLYSLLLSSYLAMLLYMLTYLLVSLILYKILVRRYPRKEIVDGVAVIYVDRPLLTSATMIIGRPIVFIAPRHRNNAVVLMHELGHARSRFLYFVATAFQALLFAMIGAMLANYGKLYFNQAFFWALGFALSAFLMYAVHFTDELYAEAFAVRRLGEKAVEERARSLVEVMQREFSGRGKFATAVVRAVLGLLYPSLPADLEEAKRYLRSLADDWTRPAGALRFAAPWLPAFAGSLTYSLGLLLNISNMRVLLLNFVSLILLGLAIAFLLALILKPIVARYSSVDPFKISLWLSSAYLATVSLPMPGVVFIGPPFLAASLALAFITLFLSSRIATEDDKKASLLSLIAFSILLAASFLVGLVAMWRLGLL